VLRETMGRVAATDEFGQNRAKVSKVLVVDDDPAILRLFSHFLTAGGFLVETADNGKSAMSVVSRQDDIDVVICDLVMPEQEGLETIMQLRKCRPELRIIAASGAFGGSLLSAARALGADAALAKPISQESLVAAVTRVLK
jgi:CheY-like chemotaxis protein